MNPFFVVGAPRSGSTLLRLMLGHHPDVCRCEEMEFVASAIHEFGRQPLAEKYRRYLDNHRGFRASGYKLDPSLGFADQAKDFLVQRRRIDGCPLVGATVHHHFSKLPEIWPEAKYIFLVRDPRDVARSCVQMGWVGTPWYGTTYWLEAYQEWCTLRELVPKESTLEIRFEDLVADANSQLERACSFLGIQFHECMLEIDKDTSYERPNPASAKSWRETASHSEVAQVEERLPEGALEKWQYQWSDIQWDPLGPIGKLKVDVKDVAVRVRYRVEKYGPGLWLLGVLARRLPLRGFEESIRRKLDDIDDQHLK